MQTMMENVREVYALGGIDIEWLTNETLNLPALADLHVGRCNLGTTTAEQNQLFKYRNGVRANELAAYFVRSTVIPVAGCAAHPVGKPGVVIARAAPPWSLAHEIGHVLGLSHVRNPRRLMTDAGTGNIVDLPPDLTASEINTMVSSPYTHDV